MKKRTGLIVFFLTAFAGIVAMAVTSALRLKRPPLPAGTVIDYILVEKRAHRLTLFSQHRRVRSYRAALGRGGMGPKTKRGDCKTPEGLFRIRERREKTLFHLALGLDYPTEKDIAMARRRGYRPGGAVAIHGLPRFLGWIGFWHRYANWTAGDIALTDDEMDELWRVVPEGTAVEIRA
jgi:murein L,D-transpeptidase YafK